MKRHFWHLALCISVLPANVASAQTNPNLETGFKPFGVFDSTTFDSVNISNGNLTLDIPILDYPQRGGIAVRVRLTYNNKGWRVIPDCFTNGTCNPIWTWNGNGVQLLVDNGVMNSTWSVVQTGSNSYLTVFKAITPDGGSHQLAQVVGGTTYESIDASGIRYNGWMGTGTNRVLLDRSGFGPNGSTTFARDTNGNETSNQTDGSVLDTLGRTVGNSSTGSNSGPNGCSSQPAGIICLPGPNGSARLIKLTYTTVSLSTNFQARAKINDLLWPVRETTATASMLQSVAVYDGVSWTTSPQWTFQYSSNADGSNYGDLTQITLPTGGTVSYSWGTRSICGNAVTPVSRGVTSRTINANDGMGNQTTTYSAAIFNNSGTVTVTDPASNDAVHTITGLGGTCSLYDTQTDYYKGTGANRTLLQTVQTAYSWTANPFDTYGDGTTTKANVVPTSVTTKWPIPNSSNFLVSQVQTDYDNGFSFYPGPTSGGRYGRVLERREYDYGVNTPGPLLRKTDYTYKAVSGNAYLTANLLDLVATKTIYNGTGVQMAKTTYTYDGTTLQSSGVTQQHLSLANPGTRGNLTLVQDWLNTNGSSL